jgi:hypothetical protein
MVRNSRAMSMRMALHIAVRRTLCNSIVRPRGLLLLRRERAAP